MSSVALRKEGGVSSGGGDDRACVDTDAVSGTMLVVCPAKGAFDCDDHCESALDQVDARIQAILDDICSAIIFTSQSYQNLSALRTPTMFFAEMQYSCVHAPTTLCDHMTKLLTLIFF